MNNSFSNFNIFILNWFIRLVLTNMWCWVLKLLVLLSYQFELKTRLLVTQIKSQFIITLCTQTIILLFSLLSLIESQFLTSFPNMLYLFYAIITRFRGLSWAERWRCAQPVSGSYWRTNEWALNRRSANSATMQKCSKVNSPTHRLLVVTTNSLTHRLRCLWKLLNNDA